MTLILLCLQQTILLCLQQTKDLRCSTRLLNEKFKKIRFGGLMHIPPMNVPHKLLKELANSFNLDKNKLDTKAKFVEN
ncbi:hypothetical protein Ahy_B01g055321 [Arachis hypogaea]|uniref:Uncharacterized protein n=1 Tax=Arachis hypogaea TaxID=3818 RepID=A0A445AVV1_ARAHY|nr:hypothetical protein Ahy_B01g055321 [Arachis hypogaea]